MSWLARTEEGEGQSPPKLFSLHPPMIHLTAGETFFYLPAQGKQALDLTVEATHLSSTEFKTLLDAWINSEN